MNTLNVRGIKLFEHQRAVIDTFDMMIPGSTLVIKSSRQKGKTVLVMNMLLRQSLNFSNQTSICVEPSWSQSKRVMKAIVRACKSVPIIESANAGDMIISFKNGSEIMFLSGSQSVDSVRGATVTKNGLLVFDEAAFLKDDFIYKTLPFRDANKAQCIAVSTPLFREGFFYQSYSNAVSNQNNFYSVDFNQFDTSMLLSAEQKEMYRKTMPHLIFLSEIEGEFIDTYGNLFGDINSYVAKPDNTNIKSCGCDWGTGQGSDFTFLAGFNNLQQMTLATGWNDVRPTEQIDLVGNLIEERRPDKLTVETNSIGEVYFDMLKKEISRKRHINCPVFGFETTNDSKRRIIEKLVTAFQNREITILDNPILKLHLAAYDIEPTKTGKITYNGQNNQHDDAVIATAIAYDALTKNTNYVFASGR